MVTITPLAANDNDLRARGPYADSDDALYPQAVAILRRHGSASISWLQRQLQIGFNTASRLIERMELEGIVGHPQI